jgi:hypothetical protein
MISKTGKSELAQPNQSQRKAGQIETFFQINAKVFQFS